MGKTRSAEVESVVAVLTQGRELANELRNKLHPTTTSRDACCVQLRKIMSCYDNALELLNCLAYLETDGGSQLPTSSQLESPISADGCPKFEETEHSSKAHASKKRRIASLRKSLPKWSERVKICADSGSEGQLDDGFHWRKYGQKDILGANHPRAYYRCTYLHNQGCLAKKQVQQSDKDHSIFEVSYRGKHTCVRESLKKAKQNPTIQKEVKQTQLQSQPPTMKIESQNALSLCFPTTTPMEFENLESQLFTGIVGTTNDSPPLLSPASSNSYFSLLSPLCLQSDFAEIMSNATPVMSFPFGNLDSDLDSHFPDLLNCFE